MWRNVTTSAAYQAKQRHSNRVYNAPRAAYVLLLITATHAVNGGSISTRNEIIQSAVNINNGSGYHGSENIKAKQQAADSRRMIVAAKKA